eukprot:TRINITY_DN112074_c0_g1_i1.p1 TRINITY_DN112074_c0_g1~~TRINITY_DN112074_c0_g1_i1.p1  ORF type:complete len:434 (+),score=59.53 TRINITY_DN112074_c0_g1_i1:97-1398(+)
MEDLPRTEAAEPVGPLRTRSSARCRTLATGLAATSIVTASSWKGSRCVAGPRRLPQTAALPRGTLSLVAVERRTALETRPLQSTIIGARRCPRKRVSLSAVAADFAASSSSFDPSEFDRLLIAELEALKACDEEAWELRSRIAALRESENLGQATELISSRIDEGFRTMEVPILPPLPDGGFPDSSTETEGDVFGQEELRRLATELYSEDAVDLVRHHVLSIIGPWDHLVRDYPLRLARFQVGQVYWTSALFGYSLRSAEQRYSLERAARLGQEASSGEETLPKNLGDYVSRLGPQEALLLGASMPSEAQQILERKVSTLFGDLGELWQGLDDAIGPLLGSPGAEPMLRQAIASGEIESALITIADLRRITLEGVAFGFLLGQAETEVNLSHEFAFKSSESEPRISAARTAGIWDLTGGGSIGRSVSGLKGLQ